LIQHLAGPFKPEEFHDTYRENVKHLIHQKEKGQKITLVPRPRKAPVGDLMDALKRSLEGGIAKSSKGSPSAAKPARKRSAA
jgi:DNA end-binding protein Ku